MLGEKARGQEVKNLCIYGRHDQRIWLHGRKGLYIETCRVERGKTEVIIG